MSEVKKLNDEELDSVAGGLSNEAVAQQVIQGLWGNGEERRRRLTAAGYNYDAVQSIVNYRVGGNSNPASYSSNPNYAVAQEIIAGKWGNGEERKRRLIAAGYNYDEVQSLVGKLLK